MLYNHAMLTGMIFDIRRYSIHDGPGIRTTLFFKGCPLVCSWCHNPESQAYQPELMLHPNRCIGCGACAAVCTSQAIQHLDGTWITDRSRCDVCGRCIQECYAEARQIVGRSYALDEVMSVIERDRAFYDQSGGGVTFSGGEPMAQVDFLLELLKACRARGLHTALDTCGYAPWGQFKQVLPLVDLVLYDLKLMEDERHLRYTGVSNHLILSNLLKICKSGVPLRLRLPLIPGINDDPAHLKAAAQFAADLPGRPPLHLLPHHNSAGAKYTHLGMSYSLTGISSPSEEEVQSAVDIFSRAGCTVIRGG